MKRLITILSVVMCTLAVSNSCPPAHAQTTDQTVIGNCKSSVAMCEKTLKYCTQKRGRLGEQTMTSALKDCITANKSAAEFLSRGSIFNGKAAALAADASLTCAKACDSYTNDATMKSCADECRKTAGNLQKIVARSTATR